MARQSITRDSMLGGLLQLKQLGFAPQTVIDVGAALGTFPLYEVFPQARHVLIEPIQENEPYLAKICQKLPNAEYWIAAATHKPGVATLQVAPELVHSSASMDGAVPAVEGSSSNPSTIREITAITLDQLCHERQLEPPYLLKIDVDGNEADVLLGAAETLKQTEYVIVEVSLFNQIHQVIEQLRAQGFVIYDIVDLAHRPGDNALWQADMVFVKASGPFRQNKAYLPESQALLLTQHLQAFRESCIAHIEQFYGADDTWVAQLDLRAINFVVFPDWSQSEEVLLQELIDLLQAMMTHPNGNSVKLLIDATDVDPETADFALSSATMYLLSEAGLDVTEQGFEIAILDTLNPMQWQVLLPHLTARIVLVHNNQRAIAWADAQSLQAITLASMRVEV